MSYDSSFANLDDIKANMQASIDMLNDSIPSPSHEHIISYLKQKDIEYKQALADERLRQEQALKDDRLLQEQALTDERAYQEEITKAEQAQRRKERFIDRVFQIALTASGIIVAVAGGLILHYVFAIG